MANISSKQKDVLNQANFTDGGINFISDLSKIKIQNEPILVVGLGGTGIDALLRVKSKVNEIFITGRDPHTGKRKTVPDNIKFIGIDTDKSYMVEAATGNHGRSYKGVYVEADEGINIGGNDLDGFVNHAVNNKLTYITDWFCSGMPVKSTTDGAGGVRQISRLSIFKNFNEIYTKFKNTISSLTATTMKDDESKLYVYILSGISGGTGSGSFLDIPYIIQDATKEALGLPRDASIWSKLVLNGYFLTPDVSLQNHNSPYIKYNGYAAMKELDYLMGLEERGEYFQQNYGPRTIYSENKPYSLVNFVSSYFRGGSSVKDAYETALLVIAENIIFFIANDANDKTLGARSFNDNVSHNINIMVNELTSKGRIQPVGYRYGVIGSSGRILPVQDIMTCLASKLLDRVNEMWESHGEPTSKEVMQVLSRAYFGFDPNSLTEKLMANVPFSFQDIKQSPASYPASTIEAVSQKGSPGSPEFNQMLTQMKNSINMNYGSKAFMESIQDNFTEQLKRFFQNTAPILFPNPMEPDAKPNYGPKFANDVLVGVAGGKELNAYKYCFQQMNQLTATNNDIVTNKLPLMQATTQNLLQQVQTSHGGKKKKAYAAYMEAMEALFGALLTQHINTILVQVYQKLMEMIVEANHQVFGVIYETLRSLHSIFDKNMAIMGNVERRKTVEGVVMSWYVVSFTDVNTKIQQILDKNGLEVPVNDLYKMIWDNRESWSTDDVSQYTVVDDLTDFLSKEFSDVLDLGLEAFLEEEFERNPEGASSFEDYIQHQFDTKLTNTAEIMFNDRVGFREDAGDKLPGRLLIQIPRECTRILSAVQAAHPNKSVDQIAVSDSRSRITYTKANYGVPLYSYALIEDLEYVYESQMAANGIPGVHLYQHDEQNWVDLPAINPMGTWSPMYQNLREKARVEKANAIFDKALQYGVIRYSEEDQLHIVVFAGDLDVQGMVDGTAKTPNALRGLLGKLKSYLKVDQDFPADIERYPGTGYQIRKIKNSNNVANAKLWFASSYQLIQRVEKEIAKYEALEKSIADVEHEVEQFASYTEYANAVLTKLIVRKGPKYFYNPVNEAIEPIELVSNSQLKNKEYPQFDIHALLYKEGRLPAAQFAQFQKDVAAKFEEFENSDYDTVYVPAIEEFLAEIEGKLQTAEFNRDFLGDAEAIITFYKIVINYLKGIK